MTSKKRCRLLLKRKLDILDFVENSKKSKKSKYAELDRRLPETVCVAVGVSSIDLRIDRSQGR